MPTRTHLIAVARQLKRMIGKRAFKTIARSDITEMLRAESGEPTTRIKSGLAADLTSALMTQGVQVHPPLDETTTGDMVRLYYAGTVLGQLIDTIAHPDPGTDDELGDVIKKVKGQWDWATTGEIPPRHEPTTEGNTP